jgi:hypothetical protein
MLVATGASRPESEGAGVDRRDGCEGGVCGSAAMACSGFCTGSGTSASLGAEAGSGGEDDGRDIGVEEVGGVIIREGRLDGVNSSGGIDQNVWGSGGCGEEGGGEEGGEEEGGKEEGGGDEEGGVSKCGKGDGGVFRMVGDEMNRGETRSSLLCLSGFSCLFRRWWCSRRVGLNRWRWGLGAM